MLEKMQVSDLNEVLELENEVLHSRWSYDQFLYELEQNEFANLFVIRKQGELVGFIDYWITFEVCQLASIAVKEKFQRFGYASKMMLEMEKCVSHYQCESIQLEVRVSNLKAIEFYKKNGYFKINIRKNYYGDTHEDAIVMAKALEVIK
ncbi:MAG: ribosomal protein S18-alanine N-acetyltransferase [Erysipelotrichaceae bacterium]